MPTPPNKGEVDRMKVLSVIGVLCLIVLGSSWAAGQTVRGNPKEGQAVYEKNCLRCHGSKLDGKGPDSQDLIVRPANLQSSITRSKTDWELLVAISNGVLFSPMHSFRGKLTDQQMMDVLSYIRDVSPQDIVS
ncbi:MAG: cytochrome c [Nitrospiraceae bacterium]|nr:MAG: cytochrome c [Nitrospiraceae bacterium]